jgi:hypothetical protein
MVDPHCLGGDTKVGDKSEYPSTGRAFRVFSEQDR